MRDQYSRNYIDDHGNVIGFNQDHCVGCGICKAKCQQAAIRIKQTMPMRGSIQEYFLEDFSLDLKSFEKY